MLNFPEHTSARYFPRFVSQINFQDGSGGLQITWESRVVVYGRGDRRRQTFREKSGIRKLEFRKINLLSKSTFSHLTLEIVLTHCNDYSSILTARKTRGPESLDVHRYSSKCNYLRSKYLDTGTDDEAKVPLCIAAVCVSSFWKTKMRF